MADIAHEWTDDEIKKLEEKLQIVYKQANDEVTEKFLNYMEQFNAKDEHWQQLLADGKITESQYQSWRHGQICTGMRWQDMKQVLAEDYANTNIIAKHIINNELPNVYAVNRNYAVYSIENKYKTDTSYTLYNRKAVENLIKDDVNLLPYAKTGSKTAEKLKKNVDLIWNRQKINNAIVQGVLQGESNQQIAYRLMKVTDMNYNSAIRNARTMMTATENKARMDSYDELREEGYEIEEIWIATLDGRTRHSHALLHGTKKDADGYYKNGLQYPGDPDGEPEEVYNCRCCEIGEIPKYGKYDIPHYSPKMGDMTFEEWQSGESGHTWVVPPMTTTDINPMLTDLEAGIVTVEELDDAMVDELLDSFDEMDFVDLDKLPEITDDVINNSNSTTDSEKDIDEWMKNLLKENGQEDLAKYVDTPPLDAWVALCQSNPDEYGMLDLEKEQFAKLNDDETQALRRYTGSAYSNINGYLRDIGAGKDVSYYSDRTIELTNLCHSALDKMELTEDLYLRRGSDLGDIAGLFMTGDFESNKRYLETLSPDELNDMFAGEVGTYFGFTSTSSQWDAGFEGEVELIIHAPEGTRASSIMSISNFGTDEGETLLGDGTVVLCEGIEKSDDGHMESEIRVYLSIIENR